MKYNGKLMAKMLYEKSIVDRKNKIFLSGRDCAKIIGISHATYSRVAKCSEPDLTTFSLLCNYLQTPMESFFTKTKK